MATRQSVLITGCSGVGIGNNLAQVFHERGWRVFATARKAESLTDLAAMGIETLSLVVDDQASVRACYKEVEGLLEGKGLDMVWHNAGRNYTVPTTELDIAEVRSMFDTNLFSIMDINKVFMPLLLRTKGTIVATGSVAGVMPYYFGSAYNASKAALQSYLATLRVELAPFGIHVVNVITAGVKSNIARTKRELPEDSIFKPFNDVYQRRLVQSQTYGMDTRAYTEEVVGKVLTSRGWLYNRNEVWAGGKWKLLFTVNMLDQFVPGGLWKFIVQALDKGWKKSQ